MAFDGVTIASIVKELSDKLADGRIYKIAQPEKDELLLTIKASKQQYRLSISADASLPLLYLTEENKKSPLTAPNFCMLLRKHIQNARILSITQPGLERIVSFELEHLNELGDLCKKKMIVEIMGKHSNIIFLNDENIIIDSIKHISSAVSSVREVLPGRTYFVPETIEKENPLLFEDDHFATVFLNKITEKPVAVYKSIYGNFTGLSPIISQEICYRAGIDSSLLADSLNEEQKENLLHAFCQYMKQVAEKNFRPHIIYENGEPVEFGVLDFQIFNGKEVEYKDSVSEVLFSYYAQKSMVTRIRQKSVDLRRVVQTALERNVKKYDVQMKQMQDTEKKDKYKEYGELLHAFGYGIAAGENSLQVLNYYTNEEIAIPLDKDLTPIENAKKYFDKYGKLKRTYEALSTLILETKAEIEHLESILTALDIALMEEDIVEIKEELIQSGYIRRKGGVKKIKITSKPFHFLSSDGFHMYVGKNNFQNDEMTFGFAQGNDWWFHAKGIPGSHVLVKTEGKELPDRTFEEAARLAAHFSKGNSSNGKEQGKKEVDYVEKKQVKKPSGGKPGFVIYHSNYSMLISTDISGIEEVK